jgi:uncharacterized protein (DUF302 family)
LNEREYCTLYAKETNNSIDDACKKIQDAASQNKFGVLAVIDLKEKMASKGVQFGPECRIIEICNPMQAKKVLETNMSISSALPCRISVYQDAGKTRVVTLKPTVVLGLFGNPEIETVAKQVEDTVLRIIDIACKE